MDVRGYLTAPIPRWLGLAAVVTSAVVSTAGTYVVMRRKYVSTLDEMVRTEVENTERFLVSLAEPKTKTPQEMAMDLGVEIEDNVNIEKFRENLKNLKYETEDESGDKIEVAQNVWTDMKDYTWDAAAEEALRSPDNPYILEHDEFYESENQMVQLTWYEGDEVLADEQGKFINDVDNVVGEDNLLRFGHGSRDPNILYIRNEKMEVDFEVVKNEGKFTEQVYGFVKHSDDEDRYYERGGNRRRVLRMREYDDD